MRFATAMAILITAAPLAAAAEGSRVVLALPEIPKAEAPAPEPQAQAKPALRAAPAPHLSRYATPTPPPPVTAAAKPSLARANVVHRPVPPEQALRITTARPARGSAINQTSAETRAVAARASTPGAGRPPAVPAAKPTRTITSATTSARPGAELTRLVTAPPPAGAFLAVTRGTDRKPIAFTLIGPDGNAISPSRECAWAIRQSINDARTPSWLPPLCGVVDIRDVR